MFESGGGILQRVLVLRPFRLSVRVYELRRLLTRANRRKHPLDLDVRTLIVLNVLNCRHVGERDVGLSDRNRELEATLNLR